MMRRWSLPKMKLSPKGDARQAGLAECLFLAGPSGVMTWLANAGHQEEGVKE
jgi:hypothetical protein